MKNCTLLLFFCITLFNTAISQDLIVKGTTPNLYLLHKVMPKENWYSVGRLYNVNAKELAKYNAIPVEKGLGIDQMIKIPLTGANTVTDNITILAEEAKVPFYHIVEKSEGLYRIALNMGSTMQIIRDNNSLSSDALATGSKIIVGYLKVKKNESSLANLEVTTEPPPAKEVIKETPKVITPVAEPKKETPKIIEQPKVEVPPTKAPSPTVSETPAAGSNTEGFFKSEFQKDNSYGKSRTTVSGKSAVFKTMAGWADNKYYALIDGVTPGSIIQLKNNSNNKIIYAKVLGEMQEIKQNHGLKIRISNAAANALDASEETFEVSVQY